MDTRASDRRRAAAHLSARQLMADLAAARGHDGNPTKSLLPGDAPILERDPDLARRMVRFVNGTLVGRLLIATNPDYRDVARVLRAQEARDQPVHAAALDRVNRRWGELTQVSAAEPTERALRRQALVDEMRASSDALVMSLGARPGYAAMLHQLYESDPEFREAVSSPEFDEIVEAIELHAREELGWGPGVSELDRAVLGTGASGKGSLGDSGAGQGRHL